MKAIRYHAFGGPEVLQLEEAPIPEPGPGEVQVKVAGYGVNPVDWKIMSGHFMPEHIQFPAPLGFELSGTITKLGEGVTGFEVGDHVFGETRTYGAACEYSCLPVHAMAKAPASLDLQDAAGLVVAGMTAWQALFDHGGLEAGQRVLIHAAAGGVGSMAVQLAKWKGAHVIATGGPDNAGFVSELGADEYIDYTKTKFEDVVQDVDLVLDTLGGETAEKSRKCLKAGGILVSVVGPPDVAAFEAEGKRATMFGMQPQVAQLEKLRDLIEDNRLNLVVSTELPLERTAEAIAESIKGHARGKIIVKVS
jgi:NADPH:quinone reductase-like Zn-dependent oxidoreductase